VSISTASVISHDARIGEGCRIGHFVVIHGGVELGEHSIVEDHAVLGHPCARAKDPTLRIGPHSTIRSHSIIYAGSRFGRRFETGSMATIRENTVAGDCVRVGTKCDLQGDQVLGDGVVLHSFVQVCQGTEIGDFAWLFPRVSLTNDPMPPSHLVRAPRIEAMAVIATGSLLLPGVSLGLGALVSAGSVVRRSVPACVVVAGNPALEVCTLADLNRLEPDAGYPWSDHFADRYPEEIREKLLACGERVRERLEALVPDPVLS
jgi:acetyltransferase-like isoleucine patch superfamily enzyme